MLFLIIRNFGVDIEIKNIGVVLCEIFSICHIHDYDVINL